MVRIPPSFKYSEFHVNYFTIFSSITSLSIWVLDTCIFTIIQLNQSIVIDIEHFLSEGKNFMVYMVYTHIHKNLQEWQYYISWKFKISSGKKKLFFIVTFRLAFFTNYFINCRSTKLHGIIQGIFCVNITLF